MTFSPAEAEACQRLVEMAWEEDLGPQQDPFTGPAADVTSQKLIPPDRQGQAVLVARASGVVAGLPAVELALSTVNTPLDRKSTRLNYSHPSISYAVFCLKKKIAGEEQHQEKKNGAFTHTQPNTIR